MNYIAIVFLAGGGMAATNCGSILSKCSFTMHIKFCMRSLIGANAKLAKSIKLNIRARIYIYVNKYRYMRAHALTKQSVHVR